MLVLLMEEKGSLVIKGAIAVVAPYVGRFLPFGG
jgi:hypothetical protein